MASLSEINPKQEHVFTYWLKNSQSSWNLSVLSARPIKITKNQLHVLEVACQSKWPVGVNRGTCENMT